MYRDEQGWIAAYKELDALWIHDDNPLRPHALLASGRHSNGFFNSRLVVARDDLLDRAAADLLELLDVSEPVSHQATCIVGPQTGATKMAWFIAYRRRCMWASPAKKDEAGVKSMEFDSPEKGIVFGETVLLCEDVLTTGGSVDLAASAVEDAGGIVLPYILVLVNRSGLKEVNGRQIIALIDRNLPTWEPDACPLCEKGSQALPAKDNWALLSAAY